MKYKCILFDLDGTLLDTTEGVIDAVKRTIRENKFSMPNESVLKMFVGPPMQESMSKIFNLDEITALQMANRFRANYKMYSLFQASLYEGILPLLKELHDIGYKIAVATNKSHQNAMDILRKFGISRYCDYAQGSDMKGMLTKKDIINLCIENMGCKKEETVLIGDSIYDLKGAEQVGIDFIAVSYGFGFRKNEKIYSKRCIFVADSVGELQRYVLKR